MKQMKLWEVQSNGVSLTWTDEFVKAERAFKDCRSQATLYEILGTVKQAKRFKRGQGFKLKDIARV